jgi:hypothetical protein
MPLPGITMSERTRTTARMISCPQRAEVLAATLRGWRASDWESDPELEMDRGDEPDLLARIARTWRQALGRAVEAGDDYCLFMEDDIEPNRFLRHNLERWLPLRSAQPDGPFFGSLYWCQQPALSRHDRHHFMVAAPKAVWGSQAVIMSRGTARYVFEHWDEEATRHHDLRMPRLAARAAMIYFHVPSLVQHRPETSTWGNAPHQASDFDPFWKAAT